jgi:hypothetical protein
MSVRKKKFGLKKSFLSVILCKRKREKDRQQSFKTTATTTKTTTT